MSSKKRRILITGASGFLGSWIISTLVDNGIEVIATDITGDHHRLDMIHPNIPDNRIDYRICDVADPSAIEALINETVPDVIIHLAALQIPTCRENPAAGAQVNVIGHVNIFEAARKFGISKIIYTSSIAAKPRGAANAPSNLYGVFKKTGEEIARIYWQDYNIPSFGLRPCIVYGVGRDNGETSAFTRAMQAAAVGDPYEIPFSTSSCFQYIGDIADVFVRLTDADWDGALISDITDEVNTSKEVLDAIKHAAPNSRITISPKERISPTTGFDTSPLRQVVGNWNETSLVDGVQQTMDLYRNLTR
jgi:nucleoside-diphosphate-sugar epimerase